MPVLVTLEYERSMYSSLWQPLLEGGGGERERGSLAAPAALQHPPSHSVYLRWSHVRSEMSLQEERSRYRRSGQCLLRYCGVLSVSFRQLDRINLSMK